MMKDLVFKHSDSGFNLQFAHHCFHRPPLYDQCGAILRTPSPIKEYHLILILLLWLIERGVCCRNLMAGDYGVLHSVKYYWPAAELNELSLKTDEFTEEKEATENDNLSFNRGFR